MNTLFSKKQLNLCFGVLFAIVLVFSANSVLAEIRATSGIANFYGADALCKVEFGSNWSFATINNADEAYINSNFQAGTYIIANIPTNRSNSPWNGNICSDDATWPETQKEVIFKKDVASFCYGDVPKTQSYRIICTGISYSAINASCIANPSTINTGDSIVWSATATGGNGSYTYSWNGTDGLLGTAASLSKTYLTSGTKYATVTVTSGSQSTTANCSAIVNQPTTPTLSASCIANPSTINTGDSVNFSVTASGGNGNYIYSWSGACNGSGLTCSNVFYYRGTYTTTVTVTSGSQSTYANCIISVSPNCIQNSYQRCVGNSLYWYDSCGNQGSYISTCGNYNQCTQNSYQRCIGNSLYWYDSCGNQGSYAGSCGTYNYNQCSANFYQRCLGNNLYWYDSCGNVGNLIQYCQNGCVNNTCQNYNYNYNYNTNLSVTKTVKNITTGYGFTSSVNANPSDMLMFMITLRASNYDAQYVTVRDVLPSNLIYNNQLVVACAGANLATCSTGYNGSGNITSGINIGTIYNGQTVTITYQAQVAPVTNFSYGSTTLTNTSNITASNASSIPSASASVVVSRSGVLGASTVSTGLTNNFWLDSFFLPLIIGLLIAWMWKAGLFFWAEKWFDSKKQTRNIYKSEKELSKRIESIQKFGR
jgi:hypothetical protein